MFSVQVIFTPLRLVAMKKPLSSWQKTMSSLGIKLTPKKSRRLGTRKQQRLSFENLEPRKMLATVGLSSGQLTVTGTAGADDIFVSVLGNGNVDVGDGDTGVVASEVESIFVQGLAGDDIIDLSGINATDFNFPTDAEVIRVFGGDGEDEITGTSLNDYLDGGDERIVGDANLDGGVGFSDIPAFISALQGGNYLYQGDINADGFFDFADIPSFIALIQGLDGSPLVVDFEFDDDIINGGEGDDTIFGRNGIDEINGGGGNDLIDGGAGDDLIRGGNEPNNAPIPFLDISALRSGVAIQENERDDAINTGWLLYSADTLEDRGFEHTENNADHFIAVRLNGQQWEYNDNSEWLAFTPQATDLLVAEVDFASDPGDGPGPVVPAAVRSLQGTFGNVNGISSGYSFGDIVFTANRWRGENWDGVDPRHLPFGEIAVEGTFLVGFPTSGDFILGGTGEDHIFGEGGDDIVFGGSEMDRIFGGNGNDLLVGGLGNDLIEGNNGTDQILGGDGNDALIGGNNNGFNDGANDILDGEDGVDRLNGILDPVGLRLPQVEFRNPAGPSARTEITLTIPRSSISGFGSTENITQVGDVFVLLSNHNVITLTAPIDTIVTGSSVEFIYRTIDLPFIPSTPLQAEAYDVVVPGGAFRFVDVRDGDTVISTNDGANRFRNAPSTIPQTQFELDVTGSLLQLLGPDSAPDFFIFDRQPNGALDITFANSFASDFFYDGSMINGNLSSTLITVTTPPSLNFPGGQEFQFTADEIFAAPNSNFNSTTFRYNFATNFQDPGDPLPIYFDDGFTVVVEAGAFQVNGSDPFTGTFTCNGPCLPS